MTVTATVAVAVISDSGGDSESCSNCGCDSGGDSNLGSNAGGDSDSDIGCDSDSDSFDHVGGQEYKARREEVHSSLSSLVRTGTQWSIVRYGTWAIDCTRHSVNDCKIR